MSIYHDDFTQHMAEWFNLNQISDQQLILENQLEPIKGTPHSSSFKKMMRERMLGNKNTLGLKCKQEHIDARALTRSRPLKIDDKFFNSGKEAAKYYNVSPALIVKWLKNGKAERITSGG